MSTYSDYLKSQGATDEDIKLLDTPVARKAYDTLQAQVAEEARLRGIAQQDFQNIRDWYDTKALPSYEAKQQELIKANAEAARLAAIVKSAQEQGLLELAATADANKGGNGNGNNNPNPGNPGFDPNKYVSKDEITGFVNSAGSGLAQMQDDVLEHMQLFPNQRLNVTALREKAVKAGKDFHTMWMQEYNVEAARKAADEAAKNAEIAKWKAEGAKEKETEIVSRMGNPDTRPLSPSSSPFAMRPASGRDKQPWELGDKSGERVERATRKILADVVH
jgi:hypothetical protein